ncbi:MAG TPA: heavy metal-binding domain-containing protein [Chthonomonadaceae bacterium]|nr:heavy metal-binding domain-containing protein [Chthonomonadaceae bacterium]
MSDQMVTRGQDVLVTTTFDLPGYEVVRYLGIVRGITVRTRGLVPQIAAGLQVLVGGQVSPYVSMCEYAREEALQYLLTHARERGANAVLGMRYDATELGKGITEVLAYGTAVIVQPIAQAGGGFSR